MVSVPWSLSVRRRTCLVTACLALVAVTQLTGAGKAPIRVLKYDPSAEKVDLYTGLESGALKVRVSPQDVRGGNLFIENLSDKPVTVDLPDAVAMVHVLKQVGNNNGFFGAAGNGIGNGSLPFGQQGGQAGGQMGGGQSIGAAFGQQLGNSIGLNQGNGNNSGQNMNGNGLFSIPPERVAQVPYQSVCLNYGKPDPAPRMTYVLVRVEDFTSDKVLQETLKLYGKGRIQQNAAQAACWHLADKKSWNELASLTEFTLPGIFSSQVPTFTPAELAAAQNLVTTATQRAEELAKTETTKAKPVSIVVKTGK